MTSQKAKVRRGLLEGKTPPECLAALSNVCAAGAQCQEVQNDPVAVQALAMLQKTVTQAQGSLANKQALAQALMAAIKALDLDLGEAKDALGVYQSSVTVVAKGNALVINKAGLLAYTGNAMPTPIGMVVGLSSEMGKKPLEGLLKWPEVPGATGYAVEVNFAPQDPNAPWTSLTSGSRRRRVVKAPHAGAQFLARVAALGNGDQQSDWCAAILVTAR